ncbi:MAG: SDR family NAD(P)-dependent oxidoreductase [Burkholderiales bacterium]
MSARRFDGRVAFVTGAARGLGEAIAAAFVEAGACVVLADVDPAVGATAGRIDPGGTRTLALPLDVRDEAAFSATFDDAVARFGAGDVKVNDAAITAGGSPWTLSLDAWDTVMAVNLRGTFVGCRIAGAHLRARGRGRIVNLSSFAGLHPSRASGLHYAASKAGVLALTRGFAMELAPHGVTVNAVAPSAIEGPQLDAIDAARRDALLAQVPVGRFGRADEVAAAVLWLASDAAGSVTGATIELTGGRALR